MSDTYDRICKNCGKRYGAHRGRDCPIEGEPSSFSVHSAFVPVDEKVPDDKICDVKPSESKSNYSVPLTQEEFTAAFESTVDMLRTNLVIKGVEYVRGPDRMHNFNKGAEGDKEHAEVVLYGMLRKHLISVSDIILHDIDEGKEVKYEVFDEKIKDCISYFIILRAMRMKRANKI